MAKKLGIIVLLCFSLCVGGVSAFADEGHAEENGQKQKRQKHLSITMKSLNLF